ncbi:thiamine-phosphate diphosphorylase [Paenibacillus sp. VTT E-133280]|uniref:thiamine phosphate synthase n=1 Tax=Paenibacillus sp. VTT E-133280 TaxID=1986222 RepID=UPI000B9FA0EE|nr:thiamine phosphate synthase [Paenibacillus sp. VTT E-133280]OZQ70155.1 thiamine-phosphate diphosphorylase [Paenibacillus sp. VTT E-133280]
MKQIDSDQLRNLLKVYFIMGSVNCLKSPAKVLKEAVAGGITMFQFREKGTGALTAEVRFNLGRRLQKICRANGVPFIVNDDIDLAIALDADGIHVGQDDTPTLAIRQLLGEDKIVGVSAHSLAEAQQAIADGADYLGIGPIYPTSSKDDAQAVRSTLVIEEIRNSGITVPLVGIGGITVHNAAPVLAAGADGISVISAIAGAEDITLAARGFVQEVNLRGT